MRNAIVNRRTEYISMGCTKSVSAIHQDLMQICMGFLFSPHNIFLYRHFLIMVNDFLHSRLVFKTRISRLFLLSKIHYIAILPYAEWLLNLSGKEVNRDV